jgi:hypothetical protein
MAELDHECEIMIIIRIGMPRVILAWTLAPVASKNTKTDYDNTQRNDGKHCLDSYEYYKDNPG